MDDHERDLAKQPCTPFDGESLAREGLDESDPARLVAKYGIGAFTFIGADFAARITALERQLAELRTIVDQLQRG